MKILIASDSYKECLSSVGIGEVIKNKIKELKPDWKVEVLPLADGGEGTMEALIDGFNGQYVITNVLNPVGKNVIASYGMFEDKAFIEMSKASGISLLTPEQRNPLKTSTYGTGMLILDALNRNCKEFLIGIGGSATNDCGMGMAQALGVKFYDINGKELDGCGENLELVEKIDLSGLNPLVKEARFTVACDVNNKLFGKSGAAYVYAKQKGADDEMVKVLDRGLRHFSEVIKRDVGVDVSNIKGSGAAGGLGGGLMAFLGAKLERGFKIISKFIGLDNKIKKVDAVITGEGKTDFQTEFGKLPYEVAKLCMRTATPCYLFSGVIQDKKGAEAMGIAGCYQLQRPGMTEEESISKVKELLCEQTEIFVKELI